MDGNYLVTMPNGANKEAFDQTLAPRVSAESEDSNSDETILGDMPGAEATARAKAFRADTDYLKGIAPKYRRGDSVWYYRKRAINNWVTATVVDTR